MKILISSMVMLLSVCNVVNAGVIECDDVIKDFERQARFDGCDKTNPIPSYCPDS